MDQVMLFKKGRKEKKEKGILSIGGKEISVLCWDKKIQLPGAHLERGGASSVDDQSERVIYVVYVMHTRPKMIIAISINL